MKKYGLIGYPLSHSFSAGFFKDKFVSEGISDTNYKLYPIDNINKIKELYSPELKGLNVTIPYKELVLDFVTEMSDAVKQIGAANTLKFTEQGIIAHNTDVYGFEKSLLESFDIKEGTKALILGTGGASKAIAYVLNKLNIEYQLVSRQSQYLNYQEIDQDIIENHQLIINTTPLGTYPNIETLPDLPYRYLNAGHMLFDLVYNPEITAFLQKGKNNFAFTQNGYDMLVYQAEKAWYIWNEE